MIDPLFSKPKANEVLQLYLVIFNEAISSLFIREMDTH